MTHHPAYFVGHCEGSRGRLDEGTDLNLINGKPAENHKLEINSIRTDTDDGDGNAENFI